MGEGRERLEKAVGKLCMRILAQGRGRRLAQGRGRRVAQGQGRRVDPLVTNRDRVEAEGLAYGDAIAIDLMI